MEILPEAGWERLLGILLKEQGTAMLLGATDSGKTTLARYIVESLAARRMPAALIDSDIGQSAIGLPGTIGMKVFCDQGDLGDYRPERMTFLGFTSPSKVLPLLVAETGRLAHIGRRLAGVAVVDTTGLISGELGQALKMVKMRAVRPAHVVAIQRGDELEHILSLIAEGRIHRLKASAAAKKRSPSSRSAYRRRKLQEYFRAQPQFERTLDASSVQFLYRGRPFRLDEREMPRGAIIGLNHRDDTIALGIIEEVAGSAVSFQSPLRSLKGIDRVVCGDMTMPLLTKAV